MQRVKLVLTVTVAMLVWGPGALAAGPRDIYEDLSDNGKLDATYTRAELDAYSKSASVQGYGNPVVTPPGEGVAGQVAGRPPAAEEEPVAEEPLGETVTAGTLPFTGAEMGIFAIVGAALLAGGMLLRLSARKD